MCDLKNHLEAAIEILRGQMYQVAEVRGRASVEVLALSKDLDRILNLYERLKQRLTD